MFPVILHVKLSYHYGYHFINFNGNSSKLPSEIIFLLLQVYICGTKGGTKVIHIKKGLRTG